jgi:hypothetical protein
MLRTVSRFRVVRDSAVDEVGGLVTFDCNGPDEDLRSVTFRKGEPASEDERDYVVEARVRIVWVPAAGGMPHLWHVRLVDAVEVR